MIVVELAGPSGVGKSTVTGLVAERLRDVLGTEAVAALPEKGVPRRQRKWTRFKRWCWVGLHPSAFTTAWKTTATGVRTASFGGWIRSLSTLGLARKAADQGVQVALVDQGILRLPVLPEHLSHVPRAVLPDLVLQLVADPQVLEQRRLQRSKKKLVRHQENQRIESGRKMLVRLGPDVSPDERRSMLIAFGQKYCEPPFEETELQMLLNEAVTYPADETTGTSNRPIRCDPRVCEQMKEAGVHWERMDTSCQDVKATAEQCVRAILEALGHGIKSMSR